MRDFSYGPDSELSHIINICIYKGLEIEKNHGLTFQYFFGRSNKLWPAISIFELPKMGPISIKEMSVMRDRLNHYVHLT